MTITKTTKRVLFLGSLAAMFALFSRCTSSSSGSGGGAAATTFSISGNLSVGTTASSMSVGGLSTAAATVGDVNAQATQCSDGYYYKVYCISYNEPPTTASGAVTCSGSSGSFTVAGLPLNAAIGCFVRRSTTDVDANYSTLGTIEIPAPSLTGGTTTIVSQGDLNLAINLNTDGSTTTTVTGGDDKLADPSATNVNPSQYTGFWSIECDATTTDATLYSPTKCKCQMAQPRPASYDCGNAKNPNTGPGCISPEQACINDGAADVTSTQQFIDLHMFTATPQSNVTTEGGQVIPAGTQVPIISVWAATGAASSTRNGGGDGAATVIMTGASGTTPVAISWDNTLATDPIGWTTTGTVSVDNGVQIDFAAAEAQSALPTASSTTAVQWKNYLKALYDNSTGFTCTWGVSAAGSTDAGCLGEFANRALRDSRSVNVPIMNIDRNCDNTGCDGSVANARIYVDGFHADYNGISWGNSTNAVVLTMEGISPRLRNRYVFEPFQPSPTGGGFTQHEYHNENFSCSSTSGTSTVVDAACTGTMGNWVNCGIRNETAIQFTPQTATSMKLFFENRSNVTWATLTKYSSGTPTYGTFSEALSICESQVSKYDSRFQVTATKQ